ncbi:hypothetical protein Agub_g1250, partial [Astrephomene gubernaculifera]
WGPLVAAVRRVAAVSKMQGGEAEREEEEEQEGRNATLVLLTAMQGLALLYGNEPLYDELDPLVCAHLLGTLEKALTVDNGATTGRDKNNSAVSAQYEWNLSRRQMYDIIASTPPPYETESDAVDYGAVGDDETSTRAPAASSLSSTLPASSQPPSPYFPRFSEQHMAVIQSALKP